MTFKIVHVHQVFHKQIECNVFIEKSREIYRYFNIFTPNRLIMSFLNNPLRYFVHYVITVYYPSTVLLTWNRAFLYDILYREYDNEVSTAPIVFQCLFIICIFIYVVFFYVNISIVDVLLVPFITTVPNVFQC